MDGSLPIGILVSVMNELSSSLTVWQITSMLLFRIRLEQGNKKLGPRNSTLKTVLNKCHAYNAVFASIIEIRIWIEISVWIFYITTAQGEVCSYNKKKSAKNIIPLNNKYNVLRLHSDRHLYDSVNAINIYA